MSLYVYIIIIMLKNQCLIQNSSTSNQPTFKSLKIFFMKIEFLFNLEKNKYGSKQYFYSLLPLKHEKEILINLYYN
jgi:hypothetical protein